MGSHFSLLSWTTILTTQQCLYCSQPWGQSSWEKARMTKAHWHIHSHFCKQWPQGTLGVVLKENIKGAYTYIHTYTNTDTKHTFLINIMYLPIESPVYFRRVTAFVLSGTIQTGVVLRAVNKQTNIKINAKKNKFQLPDGYLNQQAVKGN